jgi:pimeloyl-ACP methyl ester carboxylesterase
LSSTSVNAELMREAQQVAARLGGCDPSWLLDGFEPRFETVEGAANGPHMILLHGLFGALSNWDSTFPLFERFTHPIALHFPLLTGHRSEIKVKALALYTWYFIKSRGLGPVVLCGNSMGGHVALRLALAAPDVVDSLILSGSSGLYEHSVDALPVRPNAEFVRDHMRRVFFNEQFVTDKAVNEIATILKDRKNVLSMINAARSAKKDYLHDLLPEVKTAALLLWGEDDQVTTMDVARTFEQQMPNAKLVTIARCGHAPMMEHPEWFAAQVQQFLQQRFPV